MVFYKPRKSNRDDMVRDSRTLIPDADNTTVDEKKKILTWLSKVAASYQSEIAWESGMSEYQCRNIMNLLHRDKLIERVRVDFNIPDTRLIARVADQSAQGQGGFEMFSRKHWFAITNDGEGWLRAQ